MMHGPITELPVPKTTDEACQRLMRNLRKSLLSVVDEVTPFSITPPVKDVAK